MTMDLESAAQSTAPELRLTGPRYFNRGNDLVFTLGHPQSNGTYELQFATNLSPPVSWSAVQRGLPGQTNFVIANPQTLQGFFRLRVPYLSGPRTLSVPEDVSLSLSGVQLSGFAGFNGRLSLWVVNGFLEVHSTNGVIVSGGNTKPTLSMTGTQEALNSALRGLRYQGNTNYYGPDGLSVVLTNAGPAGAIAETLQIAITVTPVNDPPQAAADAFSVAEDTTLFVPAPGVLGNDLDVEGDPLTAVLATRPTHGIVTLNPDGSFTYQPAANFNGVDSFTYRSSDGASSGDAATVRITVIPARDPELVRLTAPTNGASLAVGTAVSLAAQVVAGDGAVIQMDFFSGTNLLGTATSAPFTFLWSGATPGIHILTARATDDSGAWGTSPPVTITVGPDCDGDGVSDALEALNGTDPCDFFNGIPPLLTFIGGNFQSGPSGDVLPEPLVIRLSNAAGVLRSNMPVTFAVTEGGALLSRSPDGGWTPSIILSTEINGTAAAWVRLPAAGTLSVGKASAGTAPNVAQVTFAATTAGLLDGWVSEEGLIAICAGSEHTLALLADGTIRGWGRNLEGQLGNA
ncbi:MAG TPA: tandem-95 repeat protein, partial [Candidatus Binatia bacterium]|nr:tandem-95 repeat protein [Candidatus Binatia bacterium]